MFFTARSSTKMRAHGGNMATARHGALLLTLLLITTTLGDVFSYSLDGLHARDGMGRAVSWWVVLKLPMELAVVDHSNSNSTNEDKQQQRRIGPTPCDCPPPDCSGLPTERLDVRARATGLCYLYADANQPRLRYFRELGYDCLGQGGQDPVSQTLRPLQRNGSHSRASQEGEHKVHAGEDVEATYWALFNDQLNGVAQDGDAGRGGTTKATCSGRDHFSAHAKGAIAFHSEHGGFYLQTSTPNFPDPSSRGTNQHSQQEQQQSSPSSSFVPLGCQVDNNVKFAQHMLAMSMDMPTLNRLGEQLVTARLCSANFYPNPLQDALASANFFRDGRNASRNGNFSGLYHALLDPDAVVHENSTGFELKLRAFPDLMERAGADEAGAPPQRKETVYATLPEHVVSLPAFQAREWAAIELESRRAEENLTVSVLVKSPRAEVPPWVLLADTLQSDLSVASWWDGNYGIPNVCAGDVYTHASHRFCMDDPGHGVHLDANGAAIFNVENLVEASWEMVSSANNISNQSATTLVWSLAGGTRRDGNHAKWGLTTPRKPIVYDRQRYGVLANDDHLMYAIFADLNMEGFPCSTSCNGSQAGRGGSFFALPVERLHHSLAKSVVSQACRCISVPPSVAASTSQQQQSEATPSFTALRMCSMGCWRKIKTHLELDQLPLMTTNASSYWSKP